MIFVPLPIFTVLFLVFVMVRFAETRDMALRPHQLLLALIAAYTVQSLLLTLRWGYGFAEAARAAALMAPVLPVLAYFAYASLRYPLRGFRLLPLLVVPVIWGALFLSPDLADPMILLCYLGFGSALSVMAWKGTDSLAASPLQTVQDIVWGTWLTAGTLFASGLTDIYVIYDFVQNDGRNIGLVVTIVQTLFVLVIGVSAYLGRSTAMSLSEPAQETPAATSEDQDVLDRITALFETEKLHLIEDLSLRRIARKLGLPDRRVSNAINRLTGQSVSQFVNACRIKDACDFLKTGDETILAVSLKSGFASKSNFNREFQRVTQMTPSAWRKAHKIT